MPLDIPIQTSTPTIDDSGDRHATRPRDQTLFFIIAKSLIAGLVVWSGVTYDVQLVGHDQTRTAPVINYLTQETATAPSGEDNTALRDSLTAPETSLTGLIKALLSSGLTEYHNSSDRNDDTQRESKRQALCLQYASYCQILEVDKTINARDNLIYTVLSIYVLSRTQDMLISDYNLFQTLQYVTLQADQGDRRGMANRTQIILHPFQTRNYREFLEVLTHELGHIVDLGTLQGVSQLFDQVYTEFGNTAFRRDDPSLDYYRLSRLDETTRDRGSNVCDFCSQYGMSNPFEDFGECHNLYLNHQQYFKMAAQNNPIMEQKYNFMASLYDGQYLFRNPKDVLMLSADTCSRSRDTTRLANGATANTTAGSVSYR